MAQWGMVNKKSNVSTISYYIDYVILFDQLYLESKPKLYVRKIFTFTMSITITNILYSLHSRAFTYSSPESILWKSRKPYKKQGNSETNKIKSFSKISHKNTPTKN